MKSLDTRCLPRGSLASSRHAMTGFRGFRPDQAGKRVPNSTGSSFASHFSLTLTAMAALPGEISSIVSPLRALRYSPEAR